MTKFNENVMKIHFNTQQILLSKAYHQEYYVSCQSSFKIQAHCIIAKYGPAFLQVQYPLSEPFLHLHCHFHHHDITFGSTKVFHILFQL